MRNKDGGPAFPMPATFNEGMHIHPHQYGMTLRDYFAAKALSCMCANYDASDTLTTEEIADAMLAAREVKS